MPERVADQMYELFLKSQRAQKNGKLVRKAVVSWLGRARQHQAAAEQHHRQPR